MKPENKILYWITFIWTALALLFVLFMLAGHLFSANQDNLTFKNSFEMLLFAMFPIMYSIGLAIALKWPLLGGVVSTTSLLILFMLRVDILFIPMFTLALLPPSLLCILVGFEKRRSNQ